MKNKKKINIFTVLIVLVWTITFIASTLIDINNIANKHNNFALEHAKNAFEKDLMFRKWVAMHGGVYVFPTKKTPPNPYLAHIPNRDLTATTGEKLTLMNPAYALRELMENFEGMYGEKGHITSLKLLNPKNKADEWEIKVLKRFDKKEFNEFYEFYNYKGSEHIRYMKALLVKPDCLKCHAKQGYKVDDIRGGVSITIPMKKYNNDEMVETKNAIYIHLLIYFISLVIGYIAYKKVINILNKEEEVQKELETEYKNLFNIIKEGIAIYKVEDNGNKFIFKDFNPSGEKIDNIKKEDIIGREIVDVFPGIKDMGLLDIFKKVYKSGNPEDLPPYEYKDNNINSWRKNYVYKLINGDIVSIYEDLTHERNQVKILNDMLKKQEFQNYYLETVFDAQTNIVVTTYGTKINQANKALFKFTKSKDLDEFKSNCDCICDMFIEKEGFLSKEKNGQNWLDHIYDNQEKIHKVIMIKDHIEHIFVINAKKLNHGDTKRSVVVLNDITTLNEQNKIIAQQSKMASMGEMMESIAHQWRQPLSIISVSSSGIKMQKELDMLTDEFLLTSCDNITNSAKHLSDTIDDFRSFFQEDKVKKDFNIKTIFNKTTTLLISKFKNRGIKLIENIDDLTLNGFGNELVQVFMNILNNARDELEIKDIKRMIFIDIYKENNNVIIKIKDNAGGIPKDVLPKIFDSHFTTKQKRDGTGIGLHMTKRIIENSFSGTIEAKNIEFQYDGNDYIGAEFIIYIPIQKEITIE